MFNKIKAIISKVKGIVSGCKKLKIVTIVSGAITGVTSGVALLIKKVFKKRPSNRTIIDANIIPQEEEPVIEEESIEEETIDEEPDEIYEDIPENTYNPHEGYEEEYRIWTEGIAIDSLPFRRATDKFEKKCQNAMKRIEAECERDPVMAKIYETVDLLEREDEPNMGINTDPDALDDPLPDNFEELPGRPLFPEYLGLDEYPIHLNSTHFNYGIGDLLMIPWDHWNWYDDGGKREEEIFGEVAIGNRWRYPSRYGYTKERYKDSKIWNYIKRLTSPEGDRRGVHIDRDELLAWFDYNRSVFNRYLSDDGKWGVLPSAMMNRDFYWYDDEIGSNLYQNVTFTEDYYYRNNFFPRKKVKDGKKLYPDEKEEHTEEDVKMHFRLIHDKPIFLNGKTRRANPNGATEPFKIMTDETAKLDVRSNIFVKGLLMNCDIKTKRRNLPQYHKDTMFDDKVLTGEDYSILDKSTYIFDKMIKKPWDIPFKFDDQRRRKNVGHTWGDRIPNRLSEI